MKNQKPPRPAGAKMLLITRKHQESKVPAAPPRSCRTSDPVHPDGSHYISRVWSLKPDQSTHPCSPTKTNAATCVTFNFLVATLKINKYKENGRIGFNAIYPSIFKLSSLQHVININIINEIFHILFLILNFEIWVSINPSVPLSLD